MNKLLPKTTLFILFLITATVMLWLPTHADEPTAVHLASFDVVPLSNAVRIDWETATELGTAGFRIKRAVSGGTEGFLTYVGDNGFIPATGTGISGSIYTVTDNQVQIGRVYTYILIELENSGAETELARATVTVGSQPTNTPIAVSGGSGSNATATPKATVSSSTTATATPITASKTVAPTNTPPSFITVTPKSVQPTAVPTQNTSTTPTNTNNTTQREETVETANNTITGVTDVYAQEAPIEESASEEIAAQPVVVLDAEAQEGYPGVSATAVTISEETYPNDAAINESSGDPSPTPVPVIGSTQGYTEPDTSVDTSNSGGTASSNNSRIFLWLGFIVALLIFATGLIGAIILFTRKSQ